MRVASQLGLCFFQIFSNAASSELDLPVALLAQRTFVIHTMWLLSFRRCVLITSVPWGALYSTTVILTPEDRQKECGHTGLHSEKPIQKNFICYIKYIFKEFKKETILLPDANLERVRQFSKAAENRFLCLRSDTRHRSQEVLLTRVQMKMLCVQSNDTS